MKTIADATALEFLFNILSPFKDEGVVAIAVVRMAPAQTLVDQCGQFQSIGNPQCGVQCRIFMAPDGVVHPIKDEGTVLCDRLTVQHPRPLG